MSALLARKLHPGRALAKPRQKSPRLRGASVVWKPKVPLVAESLAHLLPMQITGADGKANPKS